VALKQITLGDGTVARRGDVVYVGHVVGVIAGASLQIRSIARKYAWCIYVDSAPVASQNNKPLRFHRDALFSTRAAALADR
jgi:hypothetical protein